MAKGIIKNYTFVTATKTITLTDVTTVRLDKLALITDVTTNKILYNFADVTIATATVATNTIILSTLQGGELGTDKLRIDYDVESSDTSAFTDTTQPVTATTLPLPTGAATSALQTTQDTSINTLLKPASTLAAVTTVATVTSLTQMNGAAIAMNTGVRAAGVQRVTIATDDLVPVSAASLPLPTGAATSALQSTQDTSINTLLKPASTLAAVTTVSTVTSVTQNPDVRQGTATNLKTQAENYQGGVAVSAAAPLQVTLANTGANATAVKVDGSAVTQPVSAASLPLPALAATSTKQSDGSQKTQLVDGAGVVIGPAVVSAGNNLPVALGATNYVLSTVNTSVAQLAVGATFTGGIETTFNQQSYSILLTSDQDGPLTLRQYTDAAGTFVNSTVVINVKAGVPIAQSNVVNGNYFSLTFKNVGAATTTTLNINTAYGTIPATTQLNNAPQALNEIGGTALTAGQKTGALSIPVVLPTDTEALTRDNSAGGTLEEILLEIQAQNESNGVDSHNTNRDRILNGNLLEVVGIANTRDRIKTKLLTLSATTAETTLIPGDQNVYNDVLAIVAINTSASTSTRIDIRDDLGGAVIIPLMSIGGSTPVGFSLGGVAIPQTTRGATWTAQCATSTTDVRLLVIYSIN